MTRVEPNADMPPVATGLARIELAWLLSKAAWAMSGQALPSIPRSELPIRRVRRSDE
jgi:hypothetical protein